MIEGEDISDLVEMLRSRSTRLYHSCQFKDLLSYLEIGGIPSRSLLQERQKGFTGFDTDEVDRVNGVWDKVFVNLSDFGSMFGRGRAAVPTPYGPIQLILDPECLRAALDVAVCLRSAGEAGFDRKREALDTVDSVDALYTYPRDVGLPKSRWIKFVADLRREFHDPRAQSPEVSVSVEEGFIPFWFVQDIIVDPYVITGLPLLRRVHAAIERTELPIRIVERRQKRGSDIYSQLAKMIAEATPPLAQLVREAPSEDLRDWAEKVKVRSLEYQWKRYGDYLREGTLIPIKEASYSLGKLHRYPRKSEEQAGAWLNDSDDDLIWAYPEGEAMEEDEVWEPEPFLEDDFIPPEEEDEENPNWYTRPSAFGEE